MWRLQVSWLFHTNPNLYKTRGGPYSRYRRRGPHRLAHFSGVMTNPPGILRVRRRQCGDYRLRAALKVQMDATRVVALGAGRPACSAQALRIPREAGLV